MVLKTTIQKPARRSFWRLSLLGRENKREVISLLYA